VEKDHCLVEGYANLVAVYIAMEDFRQARYWLQKGKMHNPDNEILEEAGIRLEKAAEDNN
jgi:hypothetical protein